MSADSFSFRDGLLPPDIDAIRKMVTEAGVFSPEEIDVAAELAEDRLSSGVQSHYHFFVAEHDGTLIGYTCFGRVPLTDERYDLYWIITDPKAQRQGIASELMMETEEEIRRLGGKALYAETSSRAVYLPAHRFYLKHEFSEQARLKNFYADGDDKVIFGKTL